MKKEGGWSMKSGHCVFPGKLLREIIPAGPTNGSCSPVLVVTGVRGTVRVGFLLEINFLSEAHRVLHALFSCLLKEPAYHC